MQEMDYEEQPAENQIMRTRQQLSAEARKREILATSMPQGGDTIRALQWLDNNNHLKVLKRFYTGNG